MYSIRTKCLAAVVVSFALAILTSCGGGGSSSTPPTPPPTNNNPAPTAISVSPTSATAGASSASLTVTGSGFIAASTVQWNGSARPTTYVSATQLTVAVSASDLAVAGTAQVAVTTPSPGGGTSSALTFTINNPAPVITATNPAVTIAGSAAATVTVTGTGFVSTSIVQWNGSARATTFVSATQLQAAIPAADWATAGTAQITVANPAPGGGASAALTFAVNNPAPVVTTTSPSSVGAGSSAITVTVNGTGFIATSVVQWNGSARSTTYLSSTQLQAALSAADLASGGNAQITVANAAPGGGVSGATTFTVNNPAPAVASVTPSTVTVTDTNTVVSVNGSGFVPTSVAQWKGVARTTAFMSANLLQVTLTAADLAATGTGTITVSNPAPGGGASSSVALPIEYAAPLVSSLSPNVAVMGSSATTINVYGTGFAPASVVQCNGTPLATAYMSSGQLRASIPAANLTSSGAVNITVVTPAPGGGSSAPVVFTITTYPVPTITTVSPNTVMVNSPDTPISVYGTGFQTVSNIQVNGTDLPTNLWISYYGGKYLTANVPASYLTAVGTLQITVNTPPPSGGTSNAVSITIAAPQAPTITSLSPSSAPIGGRDFTLSVYGSNFVSTSTVLWNGSPRPTTYVSNYQLTAAIPASDIVMFTTAQVSVQTPPPGGGTTASMPFSTYLALPTNDLVWDSSRQVIWASVPSSAGPALGNSLVPIDPYSGNLGTPIWVGSEPRKLSLSDDHTTMWVTLGGAPAVRKVDLTAGIVTPVQVYFAGGWGMNNYATDLAVMAGSPSTVAVSAAGNISIYDNDTARAKTAVAGSYLAFGANTGTLYSAGSGGYGGSLWTMTIDATGVANSVAASPITNYTNDLQYDAGKLFYNSGAIVDATTAALLGTFAASGPVVSDSALGRAYILNCSQSYCSTANQITAFDIATMVPVGSFPVAGLSSAYSYGVPNPSALIRWGQDGLAFRTDSQVYVLRSTLVRDLSAAPADVSANVAIQSAPVTGSNTNLTITVTNNGPNGATHVTATIPVPPGAIFGSATPSQGTCSGTSVVRCELGAVAAASSATVTLVIVPTAAGTLTATVSAGAAEFDSDLSNNSARSTATVTGSAYSAVPVASSLSPASVNAGSSTFTLTVTGANFVSGATVKWNGATLATTFVSDSQLTASVDASLVAAFGQAQVSVTNPAPGGGDSAALPFSIFQSVSLDTNDIVFDPFTRKLWASIPSTATQVTGNSIVSIDPLTGAIGTPVFIGSEPKALAISDDGKYLYAALAGSNEVRRFDLATQTPGARFTTTDQWHSAFTASDLAVMPGFHDTIATTGYAHGIQVWDVSDSGTTGRPLTVAFVNNVYEGDPLAWGDATHLYANDSGLSPSTLHRFSVGPTSFAEIPSGGTLDGVYGNITMADGLLYSDGGGVVDPTPAAAEKLVGRYTGTGGGYTLLAVDSGANRVFSLTTNSYGVNSRVVTIFDAKAFVQRGALEMDGLPGDAFRLIRWGSDGLAFRTAKDFWGSGTSQIYFVRGSAVLLPDSPPLTPVANSVAPSSIVAGSGNTWLVISGSQFAPGAVARWNGAERTTVLVDATHLKVAIPASDLAGAGTANLTVVNPGTSASGTLTFTIQ